MLVDAEQLEDEVGQSSKEKHDDTHCAGFVLVAGEVSSPEEDENGNRHSGYGRVVLSLAVSTDDDDELHGESEEEEEIKLQQCNVDLNGVSKCRPLDVQGGGAYLIIQKPLLHPVVGTNLLQNIPGKDLVQFPRDPGHDHSANGQYDGNGNEKALDLAPECVFGGHDCAG